MSAGVGDGGLKWLNAAGSLASLIALGYVWHLFGAESRRDRPAGLTIAGLPKTGRISLATAKKALRLLPPGYGDCGITAKALREGMEVEREHRDVTKGGLKKTALIAAAHLCESARYYEELERMERKLKKGRR